MSAANIANNFSSAYAGTRPDESLNLPGKARKKFSSQTSAYYQYYQYFLYYLSNYGVKEVVSKKFISNHS
jgi:hypothetical protein